MKMLMSKFESFACQNGHYKLTSTYQCENTIFSALLTTDNSKSKQVFKGGGEGH